LSQLSILLPSKENKPDWVYMENYIKALYSKERESISAVANYVEIPSENRIDIGNWQRFHLYDMKCLI